MRKKCKAIAAIVLHTEAGPPKLAAPNIQTFELLQYVGITVKQLAWLCTTEICAAPLQYRIENAGEITLSEQGL